MKAQVSRLTHDRANRFSAVFLSQARMVTDADWNEMSLVARDAVVGALEALAGSGVPAEGGVVRGMTPDGRGTLAWGSAVVDGITALVAPASGDASTTFDVGAQADLIVASGSGLVEGREVYLDVWERTVTSIERPGLADPAWNGADTAFRGQVMAQVKQCGLDAEGRPAVANAALNPAIGNARLTATLRDSVDTPDPCDPCAAELDLPGRVGNALFRLELHDVSGPSDPTALVLTWSMENAGEQHRADAPLPNDFTSGDHHFEFYDLRTEQSLGVFLEPPAGWDLTAAPIQPNAAPAPANPVAGAAWTGIRRWDGWCRLAKEGDAWTVAEGRDLTRDLTGNPPATIAGDVLTLPLSTLELKLDLSGGADGLKALRGDHWLVEIRGHEPAPTGSAPDPRCRVVSETPIGVRHHYLHLGRWEADGLYVPADDVRRALSFPALTDIDADHVGYAADCPNGLFGPSEMTVKRALDRVCRLDAGSVAYSGDCTTVSASTNVKQAIDALCEALGRRADDCRPRLSLFGRGVICGLLPSAGVRNDPRKAVVDAILGIVRREPDGTTLTHADFLERVDPPVSDARRALLERLAAAGDQLGSDDVRAAIRGVEPNLRGDALAIKLNKVLAGLRFAEAGRREAVAIRFGTSAGTVIDGRGCYHDVPALELTAAVDSWSVVLGFIDQEIPRLRRALEALASTPSREFSVEELKRDLGGRLDLVLTTIIESEPTGAADLRKRIEQIGEWPNGALLDRITQIAINVAKPIRRQAEAQGWLFLVFDDVGRPALDFREKPPDPWLHPPRMLMPADPGFSATLPDLHVFVDAAINAVANTAPEISARPDTREVLNAALDDHGVLRLGRMREALYAGFTAADPAVPISRDTIDSSLATMLAGRPVTRPLPDSVVLGPIDGGITIGPDITIGPGRVPVRPIGPDIVAIGDPPDGIDQRLTDIWAPYGDLACPQPNDGSVCLGKVGVYGDAVVVVPDDREQIVTSPANLNAVHAATRRPAVFADVFAATKAGAR